MLEFTQTDTEAVLILTLTELITTPAPGYYFLFTHVTTKETVSFTKANGADESEYPSRYNKFTIDPSDLFQGMQPGEWHFKVYENNADGALLEQGKLLLNRATAFEYETYDSSNSFKTYNG